jgi:hypothetical protein
MNDSPRDITLDALEAVFTLAMDAGAPEQFQGFTGKVDPQTGDTTLTLDTGDGKPWEGIIAGADVAAAIGADVQGAEAPKTEAPPAAPAATPGV